jgi:endonuclease/exonuclease/phosphatase family metal-dependent hydrolase
MSTSLRIASFNVENLGDGPRAAAPLAKRIAVLRPQLARLDADILCLQEVDGQHPKGGGPRGLRALDALLAETPYAGFHRVASHSPHGPGHGVADRHNLVILSRHPIRDCREVRHDYVAAPSYGMATATPPAEAPTPLGWDRPILQAEIALPDGRTCHVLNLHLRAPLAAPVPGQKEGTFVWRSVPGWAEGFFMATVKRVGQATEARMAVDRILDGDPNALICVAGDCNAEEREMPLRVLCADPDDTGNAALAMRSLINLEHRVPAERRFTVRHGGHNLMLDHLLASQALARCVSDMAIHNDTLGDELVAHAAAHASPESYHAPLVAAFEL